MAVAEEASGDEIVPSGTNRQHRRMRMLWALGGMRDGSEVYVGEMSQEKGASRSLPADASTDVDAAYQVALEAIGKLCAVHDVVVKYVEESHSGNTGAFFCGS